MSVKICIDAKIHENVLRWKGPTSLYVLQLNVYQSRYNMPLKRRLFGTNRTRGQNGPFSSVVDKDFYDLPHIFRAAINIYITHLGALWNTSYNFQNLLQILSVIGKAYTNLYVSTQDVMVGQQKCQWYHKNNDNLDEWWLRYKAQKPPPQKHYQTTKATVHSTSICYLGYDAR